MNRVFTASASEPVPTDSTRSSQPPLPEDGPCLDTVQLARLEQSFRGWADNTPRRDIRLSRRRILLIFLLIRYTGAKLNEVLQLDPFVDIDGQTVCIRDCETEEPCARTIAIAEPLGREIEAVLLDPEFRRTLANGFAVDPAFVRRKFYERAEECGFAKHLGGPEMIRRARAVELMRGNIPLPAVQKLLGHATPSLTAVHASFSEEELRQAMQLFIKRESSRKTSARNSFFGKIVAIERGDVQARISLVNLGGHQVASIITRESLDRLGLRLGQLITAEVKAPWIILQRGHLLTGCSADNRLRGEIARINRGTVNSECVIRLDDRTELCALVSTSESKAAGFVVGEQVWAIFNGFSVILHTDD
ncbi:MAG: TOBE domain-containing protein [Desulfobulbus sp.]|jgi:molybdate transport system regulatory protein|uniref:TOBE domain-containing protein n=1 Tax=Desulfobulbus sp. TaxID=895 RepID=UPI00283FEF76|nr:TOBE domain-containing protein [Desulfobulbus sp.]MDR2550534.1 TOBE domain-containing protein [Desulfobulbus sp.]